MKKVILKLAIPNDKARKKAMEAVCKLSGIDSIAFDMKDQKLTIVGDVDPVKLVSVLRKKRGHADLVSVGPAKEEKKEKDPQISYPPYPPYWPYPYPYPNPILYIGE